ncbi:MAG: ABC transporter permease [Actinomycetes bacterium]
MNTFKIGVSRGNLEIRQFLRQRESVVFTLLFPVLLLLIFGSVFKNTISPGVTFSQYFVAGMIASGLINTGFQQLAIMIPLERDDGTLKRLRGTPMPPASYFIGKILAVLASMFVQILLLLLVGTLIFGVHLPTDMGHWITFTWVTLLGITGSTLLGIAFSSVPRSGRGASAMVTPIVLVLQFTSGVFFIFKDLPSWMQNVASIFPLKWLTQGMRSVFLPNDFASQEVAKSWQHGQVALMLSLWIVIGLLLALKTFRWERSR